MWHFHFLAGSADVIFSLCILDFSQVSLSIETSTIILEEDRKHTQSTINDNNIAELLCYTWLLSEFRSVNPFSVKWKREQKWDVCHFQGLSDTNWLAEKGTIFASLSIVHRGSTLVQVQVQLDLSPKGNLFCGIVHDIEKKQTWNNIGSAALHYWTSTIIKNSN